MMRRLIDTTVPGCCAVAVIPIVPQFVAIPTSVQQTLGETLGVIWAVIIGALSLVIVAGIWLRRPRPGLAFKLEWPALVAVALLSTVFGICNVWIFGWSEAWTRFWYLNVIGLHSLARFLELAVARRTVKRQEQAE